MPANTHRSGSFFNAWVYYCGITPVFSRSWKLAACMVRSNLPQGSHLLDYGCGAGGLLKRLARQHFVCTGVEWGAWLLQEAGRHLTRRHSWGDEPEAELILADTPSVPVGNGTFDLVISFLGLHAESAEERELMLQEFKRLAPKALLIDWQMAERNLDIPASTLSSGLARAVDYLGRRGRKEYIKEYYAGGALEGILYTNRNRFKVLNRKSTLGGSLGLALVEWM